MKFSWVIVTSSSIFQLGIVVNVIQIVELKIIVEIDFIMLKLHLEYFFIYGQTKWKFCQNEMNLQKLKIKDLGT